MADLANICKIAVKNLKKCHELNKRKFDNGDNKIPSRPAIWFDTTRWGPRITNLHPCTKGRMWFRNQLGPFVIEYSLRKVKTNNCSWTRSKKVCEPSNLNTPEEQLYRTYRQEETSEPISNNTQTEQNEENNILSNSTSIQ